GPGPRHVRVRPADLPRARGGGLMGLVPGVLAFNAVLTATGYCLLYPVLRGCRALGYTSYAGVALLLGTGLVGVVLCALLPLGVHLGLLLFAGIAVTLGALGLASG